MHNFKASSYEKNIRQKKPLQREKLRDFTKTLTLSAGPGETCNSDEEKDFY